MKSVHYYNKNAQSFYDRTINADLSESYSKFLQLLPEQSSILDAGCGVGRDAKYFLSKGHHVVAFDASQEMVYLASQEIGFEVQLLKFQEMNFQENFDAVWASASLLHVSYDDKPEVYRKIHQALKPGGIFYASYKYGDDYVASSERDFWNMNEIKILPYLEGLFETIEMWKNCSSTVPTSPTLWLNILAKKV